MTKTRQRLIKLLSELSLEHKSTHLTSGRTSDFFIDCKQTVLTPEGHILAGELMFDALSKLGPVDIDAVAGVELGGCPLASAVSIISFQKNNPLPALYIRKERKGHGSGKHIEGDKNLWPGIRVAILEDVVTTGGSSLTAVDILRKAGYEVAGIVALVDRLEGARYNIETAGLQLVTVTTRDDFM